jgi:hypothetical protein
MSILRIASALRSARKIRIITLLSNEDLSASMIQEKYLTSYSSKVHRESIWRDLESLTEAEILSKYYNKRNKRIYYHLEAREIVLNLKSQNVLVKK